MRLFLFKTFLFCSISMAGQEVSLLDSIPEDEPKKLQIEAYGSLNFHLFDWDIWPEKRSEVDFERAVIEGFYAFRKGWKLAAELEFEHGGTGVAVEFDRFEEFGEFEYEVEKGGEVRFEEFNLKREFSKNASLSAGYVKMPFGLITVRDEPEEYFTAQLPMMENALLPTDWAEYGLLFEGRFRQNWAAQIGLVTALDGSNFNSANFIKRGSQKRFETANAENWAAVARLDYEFGYEKAIGASIYTGNTTGNRPKPDLTVPAWLTMGEAHAVFEIEPFEFVGQAIFGHLQNSEATSNANRNLSNNLNVKRTPIGKTAFGWSAELGFELFDVLKKHPNGELTFFGRVDRFDTMASTEGQVFDNPRWSRWIFSGGANFQPIPEVVVKAQFAAEKLGLDALGWQRTASLGLGFHIK